MNDIDELLTVVPGLRRMRAINADLLRILLDRRRKECTWCGQPVAKGRSTWCSPKCVEEFKQRCDSNFARRKVEQRDGGTCRLCGRDTQAAERIAIADGLMKHLPRMRDEPIEDYEARRAVREAELLQRGYARGRWREVDHIVPVMEYGGLCGPEGLRLICGACHLAETNRLAARSAGKREGKPS